MYVELGGAVECGGLRQAGRWGCGVLWSFVLRRSCGRLRRVCCRCGREDHAGAIQDSERGGDDGVLRRAGGSESVHAVGRRMGIPAGSDRGLGCVFDRPALLRRPGVAADFAVQPISDIQLVGFASGRCSRGRRDLGGGRYY